MKPSIGRIVHYKLLASDVSCIWQERKQIIPQENKRDWHVNYGNSVREGDVFPAMIVGTWSGTLCNLQVFLDGNDTYWATSRSEGYDPGQWSFPVIVSVTDNSAVVTPKQLTDEQVKELTRQVQAQLLRTAKRSYRTVTPEQEQEIARRIDAAQHEDINQQMRDAVIQLPGDDGSL